MPLSDQKYYSSLPPLQIRYLKQEIVVQQHLPKKQNYFDVYKLTDRDRSAPKVLYIIDLHCKSDISSSFVIAEA